MRFARLQREVQEEDEGTYCLKRTYGSFEKKNDIILCYKGLERTNLQGFDNEGFITSTRNDPA